MVRYAKPMTKEEKLCVAQRTMISSVLNRELSMQEFEDIVEILTEDNVRYLSVNGKELIRHGKLQDAE